MFHLHLQQHHPVFLSLSLSVFMSWHKRKGRGPLSPAATFKLIHEDLLEGRATMEIVMKEGQSLSLSLSLSTFPQLGGQTCVTQNVRVT